MDWESAPSAPSEPPAPSVSSEPDLSYKFQRLRERIREAIASGDLSGKLPGERLLARRFRVNAKTLSKALTDLAAEGVLQRSIGRGTFVAGSERTAAATRPLILTDGAPNPLVTELLSGIVEARCASIGESIRPSLLSHCSVVINATGLTPEDLYRDLLVRAIPLVETLETHPTLSTSGVLLDRYLAAFTLAQKLLLMGHEHIATVDSPGSSIVVEAASQARDCCNPSARVVPMDEASILPAMLEGLSAIICNGNERARRVRLIIETPAQSLSIQPPVALVAIGQSAADAPCSGIYLDAKQHAAEVMRIISNLQRHRPTVVMLKGTYIDRGTTFRIRQEPRVEALLTR